MVALTIFVTSVLGGALGQAFGFGFLGAPLATIALPAESVSANPIIGGFKLTNTMIATWIAMIVLIAVALKVRSGMSEVPGRFQGMVEVFIEFFLDLAERVAGHDRARQFFPLVMTIFLFIFVANWLGILPGFGTIGRIETVEEVVYHHHCYEYHYESGDTAEDRVTKANDCADHTKIQVFQGDGGFSFHPFGSVGDAGTGIAGDWGSYVPGDDGGTLKSPETLKRETDALHERISAASATLSALCPHLTLNKQATLPRRLALSLLPPGDGPGVRGRGQRISWQAAVWGRFPALPFRLRGRFTVPP